MTPEEAIRIVARNVAVNRLLLAEDEWESYAEIGQHDWRTVVDEVTLRLVTRPSTEEFDQAYAVLKARAEHGEGSDA